MMKNQFFLAALCVMMTLATACSDSPESGLPPSTGGIAEVIVIMPNRQWETKLGTTVKDLLSADQVGLNESEPMFEPKQIEDKDFSELFQKNRKIIRVIVDDTVAKTKLVSRRNVFSSPQIIFDLCAKTEDEAIALLNERIPSIIELMKDVERERLNDAYKSSENIELSNKINDRFGFKLVLPQSFYEAKADQGFGWYRLETMRFSQAVLIYTRNFIDSTQLDSAQIIAYRNAMTKEYIPGELKGSYMTTETLFGPVFKTVPFCGGTAVETRGLWKTEGDFMGGPFLSYTFHDKKTNKVVTLEGYVYYPNHGTRDLMMQLDAVLHSYVKKK